MSGEPQTEQLQNFQGRLNEWISDQGFWFQLRYAMGGVRSKGAISYHTLRLATRALIFAVVVLVAGLAYLLMRTGTNRYVSELSGSLKEKFSAEKIELRGFKHQQGFFTISRMAMLGGKNTFFQEMELRNLRCQMGLLDGLIRKWDTELVEIYKASLEVRAGADTEESAKAIADVLFQEVNDLVVNKIQVSDMSLIWGFSERTRGQIVGSKMNVSRVENGWKVVMRGGLFTQNWLRRLEIVEIEAIVSRDGVDFVKAELRKGDGSVTFKNLKIVSGDRPEVSGLMLLKNVDVGALMPLAARGYVEGTVSGEFKLFGSTNMSDGLGYEGQIRIGEQDGLVMREKVHLLRALSVVDAFNNYRRVEFKEGGFAMKYYGGRLELSEIQLKAGDLVMLKGAMAIRKPTAEEAMIFSEREEEFGVMLEDEDTDPSDETISLNQTLGLGGKKVKQGSGNDDDSLFEQFALSMQMRLLDDKTAEYQARSYRYDGELQVMLKRNAFAKSPRLNAIYPVIPDTGSVQVDVPLEGFIYDLTQEQADEMYRQGGR